MTDECLDAALLEVGDQALQWAHKGDHIVHAIGGLPCAVRALCKKQATLDSFPPLAYVTAVTTMIPYTGLLRFLLSPKTQIMSYKQLRPTLKMTDGCLNLLLLPCPADIAPPLVGGFQCGRWNANLMLGWNANLPALCLHPKVTACLCWSPLEPQSFMLCWSKFSAWDNWAT